MVNIWLIYMVIIWLMMGVLRFSKNHLWSSKRHVDQGMPWQVSRPRASSTKPTSSVAPKAPGPRPRRTWRRPSRSSGTTRPTSSAWRPGRWWPTSHLATSTWERWGVPPWKQGKTLGKWGIHRWKQGKKHMETWDFNGFHPWVYGKERF